MASSLRSHSGRIQLLLLSAFAQMFGSNGAIVGLRDAAAGKQEFNRRSATQLSVVNRINRRYPECSPKNADGSDG